MKKIIFSTLAFSLLFLPLIVYSQNWTPEEKTILEKVKTEKTSWQDAVNNEDISIWLNAVDPLDDWHSWWTSDGGLWSLNDTKRNFEFLNKDIVRYQSINVNPIKIIVDDNVAYIWYYFIHARESKNGDSATFETKRFDVYQKMDGNWRLSASMVDRSTIDF
jgi:ketosteroid isomerase-like protein